MPAPNTDISNANSEEGIDCTTPEPRTMVADLQDQTPRHHADADIGENWGDGGGQTTTPASRSLSSETSGGSGEQRRQVPSKRGKLQGSRPQCLECDRLAFRDLDFCAPCLTAEAKKWEVETSAGGVQDRRQDAKNKNKKKWIARTRKYLPLSTDEVHELLPLPRDTRSFCVGNRVSMRVMQSMLARHDGRHSHNPLIRQYCLKTDGHSAASAGLKVTPEHDADMFEKVDRSVDTDSTWSEVRRRREEERDLLGYSKSNGYQLSPLSHENHRAGRTPPTGVARSPPFLVRHRSPVRCRISPQRNPTVGARRNVGIASEDRRELFPAKFHTQARDTASKRKIDFVVDRSEDGQDGISAKRPKSEASDEIGEWEERSFAVHHPKPSLEISSKPSEEWVLVVLDEILQMEMAVRPASLLEVGFAVKQALEQQLMEEIVYGPADEGRPIQIPLLRALNTAIWSEEG